MLVSQINSDECHALSFKYYLHSCQVISYRFGMIYDVPLLYNPLFLLAGYKQFL